MPEIRDCIVVHGPELVPHRCKRFVWSADTVATIELGTPIARMTEWESSDGALVIIPGLYNAHTHMGDSALPDGSTGLTLEQGFFRPNGYKYRELGKLSPEAHLPHVIAHLHYMARTGTVCHFDFREQGVAGAELLREASRQTGVQSIILSQFDRSPFPESEIGQHQRRLPPLAKRELDTLLQVADGFSESTMNDLTEAAWQEIRSATEAQGKLRAIHCLENAGYRERSIELTGRGDLARALALYDPHLIVHLTAANDEEIALLVRSKKTGVLNPRANANLGLPLPPIAALMRAGANLLLGTDNGMLNSPSLLAEMDFTYKVAKSQFGDAVAPLPVDILRFATTNVRAVLGGDHYGYLAEGLPASFAVLNFHQPHLRGSHHLLASVVTRVTPEDVVGTFREGRELWRAPRLVGE